MSQNIDKLKRTQIKRNDTTKQHKVFVDGHLVTSYNDLPLANHCAKILGGKVISPAA